MNDAAAGTILFVLSPALGGAGGRRRLAAGGALSGRLLVALATSRLAMSFEGVLLNFPWVSRYVLVACVCQKSTRSHDAAIFTVFI